MYKKRMEYQKIINLLENNINQLSKFKTKNCLEVNDFTVIENTTQTAKSGLKP